MLPGLKLLEVSHGGKIVGAVAPPVTKSSPQGPFSCTGSRQLAATVRLASGNYSDALRLGTGRLSLQRRVHLEKLGDGGSSNDRLHLLEHDRAEAGDVGLVDAGRRQRGEQRRRSGDH